MSKNNEQLLFSMEDSIEDNFTTFHNNLFLLGLSNNAIVLYLKLKSMCYGKKTFCFPSTQTIADSLGVDRRTIRRWLKELIDRGVIQRIEWFNEKTNMQTSNRYLIKDIAKIEVGVDKFVLPENTGVEDRKTSEPAEIGVDKFVLPGRTDLSYHEEIQSEELNWSVLGKKDGGNSQTEDDEKVWPYVKVLGDMSIDPDSRLGLTLVKITLEENASPDQLKDAIRELDAYTSKTSNRTMDKPMGFIRNKLREYISGDQICFSSWQRDRRFNK